MNSKKRILILGASGKVGNLLSDFLKQDADFECILLSRKKRDFNYLLFNPDADDWSALGKIDVLINCAGILRESKEHDFYKVHVDLVKTILANRNRLGNPKIIHISALGADKNHPIAFLKSKGMADDLLLSNPNTYILRPSIICMPDAVLVQKFKWLVLMSRLLMNRPIVPKGFMETRIQPVAAEDLMESVKMLCQNDFEDRIIDLVGSDKISFGELLQMSGKADRQIFPLELPKKLVEPVTKNFISVWFPELINFDQFQLLFNDNVSDTLCMEKLLKRKAMPTLDFWKKAMRESSL